ncbi:hypothetical protein [Streptomyces sp. NPDC097610]|uniref:hypothetical protein n=1 Tax=Streptomyces sp. NPDC097610 TaxID=3157227 RepID=UPI0033311B09
MTYRADEDFVMHLAAGGAGQAIRPGDLRSGGSVTRHWSTTPADDAEGEGEIPFVAHTLFDVHKAGSDCVRASSVLLPYRSLPGACDNAGIASDNALPVADIDGSSSSLSAQALASAGLSPGAVVTYDGVDFTWPDAVPGDHDNIVCSDRMVLLTGSGSRLVRGERGGGRGGAVPAHRHGPRRQPGQPLHLRSRSAGQGAGLPGTAAGQRRPGVRDSHPARIRHDGRVTARQEGRR